MRAVEIHEGTLEIVDRELPRPGPRDVVVTVQAAGINGADLLQLQGYYPAPPGWPEKIPGLEMAGVVSSAGDQVHEALLGRRVCGIVGGGAQATHCVIPAEHLISVPENVSWNEAGGFAEAFITAHDALVTQGELRAGKRVLISGASGGVGTAAIQIAHVLGAHVTAVTRTDEHHQALRSLGADQTIVLDNVAGIEPVDLVLELVGAKDLSLAMGVLAPFARVVTIGVSSGGARMEVDLHVIMSKRATLTGSTLRSRSREEKADVIKRVNETLLPLWTSGDLQVPLARSFALDDAARAYEFFAQPGKFGKVILRVDQ
jgi:NADPH:quinone reductase-like Zn-dependent oxidoreductase